MSEVEDHNFKTPQQRSPAYPYIALDKAVERVKQIYGQIHDHAQPREVLAKALGKPATSSATIQTFATLSQYGLLQTVNEGGARKMKVTPLARELIHPHAPTEKVNALKKAAAMSPSVFSEIWARYGDSRKYGDEVLLYYLTHDRQSDHDFVFTERAANEVLRIYRATMDYAGVSDSDKIQEEEPDEMGLPSDNLDSKNLTNYESADGNKAPPATPPGSSSRIYEMVTGERELQTGMLSRGASYKVIVSGKIGVKEIERLIAKLELDKEMLADSDDETRQTSEDGKGVFG